MRPVPRAACAALVVGWLAAASSVAAQDQTATTLSKTLKAAADTVRDAKAANQPPDIGVDTSFLRLVVLQRRTKLQQQLMEEFEDERHDEQIGATSGAAGTTTVASKGTVPKILAFAVENGAVTQSASGTVLTFRANVGGAIRAAAKQGFLQIHGGDDAALDLLGRVSLSASFDTARGNAESPTFIGDQQQLSQWTARVQIVNRRNPASAAFQQLWRAQLLPAQFDENRAAQDANLSLRRDPAFARWVASTNAALAAADAKDIEAVLKVAILEFPIDDLAAATRTTFASYDVAATRFAGRRRTLLDALEAGALVTVEYTNDRPLNAPTASNVRLVGEVGGTVDITGNASMTFFDHVPAGATRHLRDIQFAGELDARLGSSDTIPFVLSLSGRFVHQFENSYDPTTGLVVPDTTGTTAVGQLKLTIPAGKGTGAKIPLSLTFANRTDLIKESVVRANVGITYDLDSLFARLKP